VLKITARDFHCRYAPTKCDLRIVLREHGSAGHLATFPEAIHLRSPVTLKAKHDGAIAKIRDYIA